MLFLSEVKKEFLAGGCELLAAEWLGALKPHAYRCSCGLESTIILGNFRKGKRCGFCNSTVVTRNLQEVQEYYLMQGCVFLEDSYTGSEQYAKYLCSCGNEHASRISNFKLGHRCPICAKVKSAETKKVGAVKYSISLETVKAIFAEQGHKLLSFSSLDVPTMYLCNCGREDAVVLHSSTLYYPRVCKACRAEKRELRPRSVPAYYEWRFQVFLRDGFACKACNSTEQLNAHHKKSWAKYPKARFDINNGITLCQECHTYGLHVKYGHDVSEEQLNQFLADWR